MIEDKPLVQPRILIVDDYPLTRAMVQSILKSAGFDKLTSADNGASAIEALERDRIDLVICDWRMPDVSGIEVLRHVRLSPRLKKTPFLMLTAEAYRSSVEEALKEGVSDYVVKPFTANVLISKVNKLLGKPLGDG